MIPLPSAGRVRADVQRMVDLGPRLTGYEAHDRFCSWVEDELRTAGLEVLPPDLYEYELAAFGDLQQVGRARDAGDVLCRLTWAVSATFS